MTRKHEANTKKINLINFQLGLIALLSFSYFMYEISIYSEPQKNIAENIYTSKETNDDPDKYYDGVDVYREPEVVVKPTQKPINIDAPVEVIKNDTPEVETKVNNTPKVIEQPTTSNKKPDAKTTIGTSTTSKKGTSKTKKPTLYSSKTVDFLPVFPGCDKYSTNAERAICFEKKVTRLVRKKFNNRLGNELGLKGRQRIMLFFVIDQNGVVSDIKANSIGQIFDLEKEAIRVAKKLPRMEPARAGNEKVKMAYSVPIIFDAL